MPLITRLGRVVHHNQIFLPSFFIGLGIEMANGVHVFVQYSAPALLTHKVFSQLIVQLGARSNMRS